MATKQHRHRYTVSKKDKPFYKQYPITAPRFWHGLRFGDYLKLLARNKFAIHPAGGS